MVVLASALVVVGCGSSEPKTPQEVAKHGLDACVGEYPSNKASLQECEAEAGKLEGVKEAAKEARDGHPCYENTEQEVIDECYADKHLTPAEATKQEAKELARAGLPCGAEGTPAEVIADCETDGGHFK